eukprot:TRINITY_DN74775_c0_g1_i1.p1 TRINITY_DN74775_c0_g1~~TRINITY_DN74775_c0_g1_i1.p1  ORF type:complete len:139 (-),score=31.48 TRINITY_DN74775_c0_g1_i1:127-543(-)
MSAERRTMHRRSASVLMSTVTTLVGMLAMLQLPAAFTAAFSAARPTAGQRSPSFRSLRLEQLVAGAAGIEVEAPPKAPEVAASNATVQEQWQADRVYDTPIGLYDEDRQIQQLDIDPSTLTFLGFTALAINFFVLPNL